MFEFLWTWFNPNSNSNCNAYKRLNHFIQFLDDDKYFGGKMIELTEEEEAKLIKEFDQLSGAFDELLPEFYPRMSFLSYKYICIKLLQRNEITIPDSLFIMKNKEKLVKYELIYKRLCDHLNWEFLPLPIETN